MHHTSTSEIMRLNRRRPLDSCTAMAHPKRTGDLFAWLVVFVALLHFIPRGFSSIREFVLTETLSYNKSGKIDSIAWRGTQLAVASLSTIQVWNHTTTNGTPWELIDVIHFPPKLPVRAVALSPDGLWAASGTFRPLERETAMASDRWNFQTNAYALSLHRR